MATRIENIEARLDAIAVELAAMSATKAGGLPDEPGAVEHIRYRLSLIQEARELTALLDKLNAQADGGAWEVTSEMTA